jgi:tetratricopeptide (TPR) repeat protein
MREDRDEKKSPGKFGQWLNSTAFGRLLISAKNRWNEIRFEHAYRYGSLDETAYRLWFRLVTFFFLAIVLGGAIWFGLSYYRQVEERQDLTQAEAFFSRKNYPAAILSARQALEVNPFNLPATRILAQIADLNGLPVAVDWQQRVADLQPTVENQLQLADTGLRFQKPPFPLTSKILQDLSVTATNLAAYHLLAGRLALGLQHLPEAEEHFSSAFALDPTNQQYALNLATLRLAMSDPAKTAGARSVLEQLRKDPRLGPAALRALVVDRLDNQDLAAASVYSDELLASPQAALPDQLQHLHILQRLKSGRFATRLEAVKDQTETNANAVAEVSTWMQGNGLLAENIQWLVSLPEDIQHQRPVQLALAQAYLQNNDWSSLRVLVTHAKWGDLEYLRFALVSHANAKMGFLDLASVNWVAAVNEAGVRLDVLTTLLELAETWGMKLEQVDILKQIARQFPKERWAQQRLGQQYFATGNTTAMYGLFSHENIYFPADLDNLNNLAATALMLRTNLPQAYKWAADAYARAPGNGIEASTHAYALLLQHQEKAGLEVLRKLPDAQLNNPSVALYYGLLLVANGSMEEARPYLEIARKQGKLWPEEQQLLDTAWQKVLIHQP